MKKLTLIVIVCLLVSAVVALPASAQTVSDPTCPGSLPSHLNPGDRGEIAEVFSTLRYTPNGATIQVVYAPAQFTVLSKLCDGFTWSVQIQYDSGLSGWAVESQAVADDGYSHYWLAPVVGTPTPPITPASCPGAPPPQLAVGDLGYIAQVYSTLRDAPGGLPLQVKYAPGTFQVIEGPVCDGYLNYFRIVYTDGSTGWASEGQVVSDWGYNQYWLLPTP